MMMFNFSCSFAMDLHDRNLNLSVDNKVDPRTRSLADEPRSGPEWLPITNSIPKLDFLAMFGQ